MSESGDLWGNDFDIENIVAPVTLLREQAAFLGRKTKYIVIADVDTSTVGSEVIHTFNLIARALDNYKYFLFRIRHDIDLYPVQVYWNNSNYKAGDEPVFKELLRDILSSESTTKIIRSMLAQSKS